MRAFLLAMLPLAAHAAGYADGVSAAGASGWACAPGNPAALSIAVLADGNLLGVYPTGAPRPDAAAVCGRSNAGFALAFDRATQDQLAGAAALRLLALGPGMAPTSLAGSNRLAALPSALPSGRFAPAPSVIAGVLPIPAVHGVAVSAGAPALDGGLPLARPALRPEPPGEVFDEALPAIAVPPNATAALWGDAFDALGMRVPFAAPIVVTPGSETFDLTAHVAQTPQMPGLRATWSAWWLPPGGAPAAVTGRIALAGNAPGFSEALVELGLTADGSAPECLAHNGGGAPPAMSRVWTGILKNTGAGAVSAPVGVALPYPIAPAGAAGSCAVLKLTAGYAYLTGPGPMLTVTDAALSLATIPVTIGAPAPIPVGIGGEFRFTVGTPAPLAVYVGLRADVPLVLDAIAGSLSAAPVVNAPAASGWQPAPAAAWQVGTTFYNLPKEACAAAGLQTQPSNGVFSILRQGTPRPIAVPAGATPIMRLEARSYGALPLQKSAYQQFTVPAAGRSFVLAPGDCLLGFEATAPGGGPGVLDVEDQSTVYLRLGG